MQVAMFTVMAGDAKALDELNRFLRGHRVLSLDRYCHESTWSFCVTYMPSFAGDQPTEGGKKVDYREILDARTFALFSHLRQLRKGLAERENLPPYAIFTNEQLAEIAKLRPAQPGDLSRVSGVGQARVDKYGGAVCSAITEHEKQQSDVGKGRGPGESA